MQKPVLLVIDVVNDYLEKWEASRRNQLICAINELVHIMRRAYCPVIWVRQEFEPDLRDAFPEMKAKAIYATVKGTPGAQFDSQLAVAPSDVLIVKKRYSAFFGTDLDEILRRMQPDTIVLAGINTHACIRTTAIDAYQRDWAVVLATDCIGSYDSEHHDVTLKYMKDKIATLLTNREIDVALGLNPACPRNPESP